MENTKQPSEKMYSAIAERFTSSDETLALLFQETLSWKPEKVERLVLGVGNEVYRVFHPDDKNKNVIFRIHHGEHKGFYLEKWAMEEVAKFGVPAPHIYEVGVKNIGSGILTYCLEEEIKGVSLSSLLDDGLDVDQIKSYAFKVGQILAKIHSVKTEGYGHFIENGKAEYKRVQESMQMANDYDDLIKIINQTKLPKDTLDKALEAVNNFDSKEEPHLIHVDYAPKHIFINDGEIIGVIDFEICMSGITGTDFNRWRAQDSRISILDIIEGYVTVKALPVDFWDTLLVVQLHSALRTMLYHFRFSKEESEILRASQELKMLIDTGKPLLT